MKDKIDRLNKVINYLGITKNNLALSCGIGPSNLNKMLAGEHTITDKTLHKISETYPQINLDWLKTGEGEMIKTNVSITQTGDSSVFQNGQAGHDLNQTNNSERLLLEFISGLKSQGKLTEMTLNQLSVAMSQTDKALEMINRMIMMLEKS